MRAPFSIALPFALTALLGSTCAQAEVLSTTNPTIRDNLCVGFSCDADEDFSGTSDFSMLRLNGNPRVDFIDASNSPFPTNDWALQANETPANGAEVFFLEDLTGGTRPFSIEAGVASNALYVAAGGNVGLGTMLPVEDLHIEGDVQAAIRLRAATAASGPKAFQLNVNESGFSIFDAGTGAFPFKISNAVGTDALVVGPAGVGIGTAPAGGTLLHLARADDIRYRMDVTGTSPRIWDMLAFGGGYAIQDVSVGGTPFLVRSSTPTDAMVLDPEGIGLGTGIIDAPLHVRRTSTNTTPDFAAGILVEDTGTVAPRGLLTLRNQGQVFFVLEDTSIAAGDNTGRAWNFQNLGGEFRVTTAPGGGADIEMRLDVNGNMRIEGNYFANSFTQMQVPDYVFEPDYALRPLSELKAFVETNKHLPEVPSAATIVAEGVNLNEMQMTLLKKIEELTLYTLDQQTELARLRGLEDRFAAQTAENAALVDQLALQDARLAQIEAALATR